MTTRDYSDAEEPIGLKKTAVDSWMAKNVEGFIAPGRYELIKGGRSNLTYLVTDQRGKCYVLRRPPLSQVLATAHDMGREYRIISALYPTDVPVAQPFAYCQDLQVTGAPFYVMSYVKGYILRDAQSTQEIFPEESQRQKIGNDLIDVLALLHSIDPTSVGLSDFGKHEGYITRQLSRWWQQFQNSYEDGDLGGEVVKSVYETLLNKIPVQQKVAIVHGDYRLDNTIIGQDAKVQAVLDWEISTLGDPLADLGLLMVYWVEKGDDNPLLSIAPTTLNGFPTRKDLIARYFEKSELSIEKLDFYISFGYWKLACILQGVYNRYRKGAHGGTSDDWKGFGEQVEKLASMAGQYAAKL